MVVTNQEKYVDIPAQVAQSGDNSWKKGNYDEARSRYIESAKLYDANEDFVGESQVLTRLGELELSLENFESAEKDFSSAEALVKTLPDSESILGDIALKQAKLYVAQYQFEKALSAVRRAQEVLQNGSPLLLGDAYDQQAYISLVMGDEEKALEAYRKAANLFQQEGVSLKEASVLRAMARLKMKAKSYDMAHDLLEKCRELYRENGDLLGEASTLSAIGTLRFLIGDIANARKALMKSVFLYGKVEHHFAEAEALLYLARVEAADKEQGDFARAKVHYKKSIELYDFLQNDTMKNAVLDEYNAFLKREMLG